MNVHDLKTWKEYFNAIACGEKTFDLRKNDRYFKVGDLLNFIEVDPENNMDPTGRTCQKEISYILPGGRWGLEFNYVILSLK